MRHFHVTIVGELNLDLTLYGVPEEIPRERELLALDLNLHPGQFVGNRRAQFGFARKAA